MRLVTTLSAGLLAGVLLAPAGPGRSAETQAVAPVRDGESEQRGTLKFRVERAGSPIGTHTLTFRRAGDRLTVEVAIDLEIALGPIPLYSYTHRNTTTWRDGHVVAMRTRTDDDGEAFRVDAARTDAGELRVETGDGTRTVPGGILPSTYWMSATIGAERLLNTQKGTLAEIEVARTDPERMEVPDGGTVAADGYAMRGDIDTRIWYDPGGRWVALAFEAKGERVTYHLVERRGYVPTRPPQGPTASQAAGAG